LCLQHLVKRGYFNVALASNSNYVRDKSMVGHLRVPDNHELEDTQHKNEE